MLLSSIDKKGKQKEKLLPVVDDKHQDACHVLIDARTCAGFNPNSSLHGRGIKIIWICIAVSIVHRSINQSRKVCIYFIHGGEVMSAGRDIHITNYMLL